MPSTFCQKRGRSNQDRLQPSPSPSSLCVECVCVCGSPPIFLYFQFHRGNPVSSMLKRWSALRSTRYLCMAGCMLYLVNLIPALQQSIFRSTPQGLCDYSHVDTATISPPWCLTVTASGHTFSPGTETFLPQLTFDPRSVVFPATIAGQPVHVTAVMKNKGDTPVLFDIPQDPSG